MAKTYDNFDERILVIKLNDKPSSWEKIKERASGAWKINADTIVKKGIEHVIVLYQQEVIADFSIGDQVGYYLTGKDAGRVWMHLEDYEGSNELQGKTVEYRTANPATTKLYSELGVIFVTPDEVDYEGGFIVNVNNKDYEITTNFGESNEYGDVYIEIFVDEIKIHTLEDFYNINSIDEEDDSLVESIKGAVAAEVNDYFKYLDDEDDE